jgi:biopolymer transport protein TolQ
MALLMLAGMATIALAQGTEASNLRGWIGVDLFQLFRTSDLVGKSSLGVLFVFSLVSLAVIAFKYLHIRQAVRQTDAFIELCNEGSGELEEAFRHSADFPDSPLAQIMREGYMELEVEGWYRGEGYDLSPQTQLEMVRLSLERVFERVIAMEITHLESKLIFLATTSSVCPFIGLFGTVWGIMGAFQALSASGGGTLVTLGPGLSTALLTTVGGLACAIPATVMYNFFIHRIRLLTAQMDSFALELSNVIQKRVMKHTPNVPAGRSV